MFPSKWIRSANYGPPINRKGRHQADPRSSGALRDAIWHRWDI